MTYMMTLNSSEHSTASKMYAKLAENATKKLMANGVPCFAIGEAQRGLRSLSKTGLIEGGVKHE